MCECHRSRRQSREVFAGTACPSRARRAATVTATTVTSTRAACRRGGTRHAPQPPRGVHKRRHWQRRLASLCVVRESQRGNSEAAVAAAVSLRRTTPCTHPQQRVLNRARPQQTCCFAHDALWSPRQARARARGRVSVAQRPVQRPRTTHARLGRTPRHEDVHRASAPPVRRATATSTHVHRPCTRWQSGTSRRGRQPAACHSAQRRRHHLVRAPSARVASLKMRARSAAPTRDTGPWWGRGVRRAWAAAGSARHRAARRQPTSAPAAARALRTRQPSPRPADEAQPAGAVAASSRNGVTGTRGAAAFVRAMRWWASSSGSAGRAAAGRPSPSSRPAPRAVSPRVGPHGSALRLTAVPATAA